MCFIKPWQHLLLYPSQAPTWALVTWAGMHYRGCHSKYSLPRPRWRSLVAGKAAQVRGTAQTLDSPGSGREDAWSARPPSRRGATPGQAAATRSAGATGSGASSSV